MKGLIGSLDEQGLRRTNSELVAPKVRHLSENPVPNRRRETIRNLPFFREEALKIQLSEIRRKLNLAVTIQRNNASADKRFKRL
jgi:hypothetical protein